MYVFLLTQVPLFLLSLSPGIELLKEPWFQAKPPYRPDLAARTPKHKPPTKQETGDQSKLEAGK